MVFALWATVAHFLAKGRSVFLATLEIRKDFDSVRHNELFDCLVKQAVPLMFFIIGIVDFFMLVHISRYL